MTKTKKLSYDTRVKTFWTLAALSLSCLVVYVYAVNATVHNTVARESLKTEAQNLATHLSEMEFAAIGMKNGVSLDMAIARGFSEAKPIFISRSTGLEITRR
jgi:hypothetical protein